MFPLFVVFIRNIYIFYLAVRHARLAPTATALYKFWDMDFTCATQFLKFIGRLLRSFTLYLFLLLFIGSTKIVSHFLRNFVARSVFRRPLRWPKLCVRVFPSVQAPKNVVRCQTLRTNKRCFFLIVIKWVCFFFLIPHERFGWMGKWWWKVRFGKLESKIDSSMVALCYYQVRTLKRKSNHRCRY